MAKQIGDLFETCTFPKESGCDRVSKDVCTRPFVWAFRPRIGTADYTAYKFPAYRSAKRCPMTKEYMPQGGWRAPLVEVTGGCHANSDR